MEKGDLIVEEAERTVLADILTGENVTADKSQVIAGVVVEIFQVCHVDTWLDSLRTCHCNFSGHVVLSCVEKLSDGCKKKK